MAFHQSINKIHEDVYVVAEMYYAILTRLNKINLSNRELELLSFTSVRGDISNYTSKNDFLKKYETTPATLNNTISSLKKKGLLTKEDGKVRVIPALMFDFKGGILLKLNLSHQ